MNLKLLDFALLSFRRRAGRNTFVFITFTLLIFISLTIFTITDALRKEAGYSLDNLPDIIVQKQTGGRQQYMRNSTADEIIMLPGVVSATPRVWGFYPFEYLNTNLTIVGADIFDPAVSKTMQSVLTDIRPEQFSEGIFTGGKLADIIREIYNKDEFSFQKPDGTYITLKIAGTFRSESALLSTDTVITNIATASDILGIPEGYSADIAVNVSNPQEISTVQEKIQNISPSFRVITKEVIGASYQNMFDYKGGIFLLFFLTSLFTFFMIIFDRLSGLTGGETRETAILKAIGWGTSDVLKVKLYETLIITVTSFISAVLLTLVYVYILQAPSLRGFFTGYSYLRPDLVLPFSFSFKVLVTVFFVTVPVYGAAVIIPSWRAASADSGEVIR